MFVQLFRSYFSEEIFPWSMYEWLSVQACICFKTHQTDQSNQNHKMKMKEKIKKKEIFT